MNQNRKENAILEAGMHGRSAVRTMNEIIKKLEHIEHDKDGYFDDSIYNFYDLDTKLRSVEGAVKKVRDFIDKAKEW